MKYVRISVLAINLVLATSSNLPSVDCDSNAISKSLKCYSYLSCRDTIQWSICETGRYSLSSFLKIFNMFQNSLGPELHLCSPPSQFWLLWDLIALLPLPVVVAPRRLTGVLEDKRKEKGGAETKAGAFCVLSVRSSLSCFCSKNCKDPSRALSVCIKVPHEFHAALSLEQKEK